MRASTILDEVVAREPLVGADGKSGSVLERATLADGSVVVLKHVDVDADWIMRATGDDGRIERMWETDVFAAVPDAIDSTMLGVERHPGGCTIVMRDVSASLFADGQMVTREQSRRIIAAADALHEAFRGHPPDGLCPLEARFRLLARKTTVELPGSHPLRELIIDGWSRFEEMVPGLGSDIVAIGDDPAPLAAALARYTPTLIHGDLKIANVGFDGDRVVLVDWGVTSAASPAEVDFAHYIAINSATVDSSLDEFVDDVRAGSSHFEPDAMSLALLGSLAQLGWEKALGCTSDDASVRERERTALDWWLERAREGFALL